MAMDLTTSMSRSPFSLKGSPRFAASSSVEIRKDVNKSPMALNCARKLDLSALAVDDVHSPLEIRRVNPNRRSSLNSEKASICERK